MLVLASVFELLCDPTVSEPSSSFGSNVDADESRSVDWDAATEDVCGVVSCCECEGEGRTAVKGGCRRSDCAAGAWSSCVLDAGNDDGMGMSMEMGCSFGDSSIDRTSFCSEKGVMCSAQHWLCAGSVFNSSGRALGMPGADRIAACSSSSDCTESRLDESEGTLCTAATALGLSESEHRRSDVCFDRDCFALQQNVSRVHNRQLRFSNRLPSLIACDVFESIDHYEHCQWVRVLSEPDYPYHAEEILDTGRVNRSQGARFHAH